MHLLDRRLLVVTGKGGVGKTTCAAGLALVAAQAGKRVLVCDIDARGDLAAAFDLAPVGFEPDDVPAVAGRLRAMAMDTEASLQEYLRLHLRVPLVTRLRPLARTLDFVATAAPGVREILTIGKLAWEVREGDHDLVIADGPATGHVVGQLSAPTGIREVVQMGLIGSQTDWMLDILDDPARTGVVVVTTPEEMPVTETFDLIERLDAETGVDLAAVIANRVLPELIARPDEAVLDDLTRRVPPGSAAATLLRSAELAADLRTSRVEHLRRLRDGIGGRVPVVNVPFLFTDASGRAFTGQVADALDAELS